MPTPAPEAFKGKCGKMPIPRNGARKEPENSVIHQASRDIPPDNDSASSQLRGLTFEQDPEQMRKILGRILSIGIHRDDPVPIPTSWSDLPEPVHQRSSRTIPPLLARNLDHAAILLECKDPDGGIRVIRIDGIQKDEAKTKPASRDKCIERSPNFVPKEKE